ncbi:transglutaminase-like domain-containing protein [Solitalea lacus]|uniref:transglutaminase-like domain-containing protein n=1 Tax=Solitalea lacus TaxID=2911172 RepID=UPI001EDA7CC4|nr:transglutaminase-like domain-containing protein [Solitalea lacus]UKJ08410.1 transglutaminase-like domain-containing protein [Solitalea lacus]
MKKTTILFTAFLIIGQFTFGQTKVIRATSTSVSIRDGNQFRKNAWTISPKVNPDVYTTSSKGENVTFYTDRDSITIKVTTDTRFDFVILLNDSVKAFTQIKYEPSYLDRLKSAEKYNTKDTRTIPQFQYQDKNNPNLIALRKELKLDSIAGQGSETLKVLNLLHWIHNLIPHDGNHENPIVKNALSMINQCKKEVRGLNCRGLATVLNECYLSLGIKSRFVTCMPKDSVFADCHVINMVYLEEKKKWIWVDPTNNAYVMNEYGDLLSIEEVRERLVYGKPLLLNADANWNNKSTTTKDNYLYTYMAKNLYRFKCPLISEYNTETWADGKKVSYVELLPLDAYQQKPDKESQKNSETGTIFTNYKTNNPNIFWQIP